jgi:hypothetical protein
LDSQLWKIAYYHRFIRPEPSRASRLREKSGQISTPSKWMRDPTSSAYGDSKNWKWQYKLRHNWSQGQCSRNEIKVDEQRPLPPLHICMHDGIVYTADTTAGLRAWNTKREQKLLAAITFGHKSSPTALAIDKNPPIQGEHRITIGFGDGSFAMYKFYKDTSTFSGYYTHPASSNGMLEAVAQCSPFLITMTARQLLSVYDLKKLDDGTISTPVLLHSLRSATAFPPYAVSLRQMADSFIVAITYVMPTLLNWNVGIQELHLNREGQVNESRTASSAYAGGRFGPRTAGPTRTPPGMLTGAPGFAAAAPAFSKPSSISYSHPYLLLSHPDNTLTLFMVTSTDSALDISSGTRLWGHTSSVSGAHVEGRGKAVSVSAKGEELRIWELEGSSNRRWLVDGKSSIRLRPKRKESLPPPRLRNTEDEGIMRNWVGFDDESVVVLKERTIGRTDLIVYDFT